MCPCTARSSRAARCVQKHKTRAMGRSFRFYSNTKPVYSSVHFSYRLSFPGWCIQTFSVHCCGHIRAVQDLASNLKQSFWTHRPTATCQTSPSGTCPYETDRDEVNHSFRFKNHIFIMYLWMNVTVFSPSFPDQALENKKFQEWATPFVKIHWI